MDSTVSPGNDEWEETLLRAKDADVIHIGYLTDHNCVSLLAAAREYGNVPIITDVDDDLFNVPEYNVAFKAYHGGANERRVARMHLRISDSVTVSTEPLVKGLEEHCKEVNVLPNCLDPEFWEGHMRDPQRKDSKDVRFLFAGNRGRYGDLAEVREAFEWAMEKYLHLRLFFMGCVPDWALQWMPSATDPTANRCFSIRASSIDLYPKILTWLSPDVVFSPVVQSEFNKSKSHIKAFDAAMTGAAFLCTDWPTYGEVPTDAAIKVCGDYEWREAIGALIEDRSMRERLNARLRTWAMDTQRIDLHIEKWVNLYTRVIERGPARSLDDLVRAGG